MKKLILTLALVATTLAASANSVRYFTRPQAARVAKALDAQAELMIYCGYDYELATYVIINEVWAEPVNSKYYEIWLYGYDAYTGEEIYMPIDLSCIWLYNNIGNRMYSAAQYLRFRSSVATPNFYWTMPPYNPFVRYYHDPAFNRYYTYHYEIHRYGWRPPAAPKHGPAPYHPYYMRTPHTPAPVPTKPYTPGVDHPTGNGSYNYTGESRGSSTRSTSFNSVGGVRTGSNRNNSGNPGVTNRTASSNNNSATRTNNTKSGSSSTNGRNVSTSNNSSSNNNGRNVSTSNNNNNGRNNNGRNVSTSNNNNSSNNNGRNVSTSNNNNSSSNNGRNVSTSNRNTGSRNVSTSNNSTTTNNSRNVSTSNRSTSSRNVSTSSNRTLSSSNNTGKERQTQSSSRNVSAGRSTR